MLEKASQMEAALQAYTKAIEFSGPWYPYQALPAVACGNRSKLNRRLHRMADAAADNLKVFNFPPRDPGTPKTLIDLSLFYNGVVQFMPPRGRRVLAGGREFDIKVGVATASDRTSAGYPGEMTGIPIAQKCRRLHFLHTGWNAVSSDGLEVGGYRLHYADGQQKLIPIIYGAHLRMDRLAADAKDPLANNTKVAWVGEKPGFGHFRLFEMAWENERPDVAIESIDLISRKTATGPTLFAITVEP